MKKIFEIPVYALTKKQLRDKFKRFSASWRENNPQASPEIAQRCVEIETYPQRLWEYNHIVGYIVISVNGHEIQFNVYLPEPHMERYIWKSKQKRFLRGEQMSGLHFYVSDSMGNTAIQKRVDEMLCGIVKSHSLKRFFADTEIFETFNGLVDYKSILQEEPPDGPHKI